MKLTPLSRLLIVLAIVAGIYFLLRPILLKNKDKLVGTTTTATTDGATVGGATAGGATVDASTANSGSTVGSAASATSASSGATAFNFTPPAPVDGKLKGVVELGATGFNSFVIRVDGQKNWKLEKADFGSSLLYEKMTSDTEVKNGLKDYIANMLAFGVSGKDIHFVISSGAKKVAITDKIISTLKSMNYFVNTVTPEQEGKYALMASQPKAYESNSFVADIGSGNTKVSYRQGAQIVGLESYGSKYFQNGTSDEVVYNDVVSKSQRIPSNLRGTCFIIGGIPFELAKQIRNGKERYTVLKMPSEFVANGEKQKAGLNIYKGLADGTGCRQFVFDWDSNFTIGFLLSL